MSKARDLADSAQEINILDGKSFLDEDNLASDSATGIASQQSIKAYVDGITTTNITSTGALNSGSITSGFGNIDNGSSTITTTGAISGGSFVIGSADINENDLESIDGITAGTVSASKAVVVNTNKDITGFRNITATGTISGTVSGSLSSTTTATTQAESDDSTKVATTAYVTDKITTLIGGAPSTLNDLNELAAAINDDANYNSTLTTALATKLPLAGGTMTGTTAHGDGVASTFGDSADLTISHLGGNTYLTNTTGSLVLRSDSFRVLNTANSEQILHGTAGGSVVAYHNNAIKLATTSTGIQVTGNIANASGNLTLDVAGDIKLDADSGLVYLSDGGTDIGLFSVNNQDLNIRNTIADKDIYFQGNDGGSNFTALTLDMSDAGTATFNNDIGVTGVISNVGATDFTIDVSQDLNLDSGHGDFYFKDGGTTFLNLYESSDDLYLLNPRSDGDIIFQGNDGGSTIVALKLDMSNGGQAFFNKGATFEDHVYLQDNDKLVLGGGDDLQIYHDGNNSKIINNTGALTINATSTEAGINILPNGAVTLYHNNASKLATTSSGVTVTGTVAATSYTGDGSNLTGVNPPTTYNAVGTYVWGYTADTGYVEGDTKGSGIFPAGFIDTARTSANAGFQHGNPSYMTRGGTACSGTWRAMGRSNSDSAYQRPRPTLWVRIS